MVGYFSSTVGYRLRYVSTSEVLQGTPEVLLGTSEAPMDIHEIPLKHGWSKLMHNIHGLCTLEMPGVVHLAPTYSYVSSSVSSLFHQASCNDTKSTRTKQGWTKAEHERSFLCSCAPPPRSSCIRNVLHVCSMCEAPKELVWSGSAQVKLSGSLSGSFKLGRGVEQGSGLLPAQFLLMMDPLLRELQASGVGLSLKGYYAGGFLHADDVWTLATSGDSPRKQTDMVKSFADRNLFGGRPWWYCKLSVLLIRL